MQVISLEWLSLQKKSKKKPLKHGLICVTNIEPKTGIKKMHWCLAMLTHCTPNIDPMLMHSGMLSSFNTWYQKIPRHPWLTEIAK